MVLDLQTGDTETLGEVELQLGDDLPALVAQRPVRVEFPVESGPDCATIFQPCRNRVGQCARQFLSQVRPGWNGRPRIGKRCGKGRLKDVRDPERRIQPIANCSEIAWCPPI